jgi:hypothetical protein
LLFFERIAVAVLILFFWRGKKYESGDLNFNDLTDSQLARNRVGQSKRHRKRNGGN